MHNASGPFQTSEKNNEKLCKRAEKEKKMCLLGGRRVKWDRRKEKRGGEEKKMKKTNKRNNSANGTDVKQEEGKKRESFKRHGYWHASHKEEKKEPEKEYKIERTKIEGMTERNSRHERERKLTEDQRQENPV